MKQLNITGTILEERLASLPDSARYDIEAWVVNSVKLNMIKKMDNMLESEGRLNLRKLLLVPVFSISELTKRVNETAPEIRTVFFKELINIIEKAELKLTT